MAERRYVDLGPHRCQAMTAVTPWKRTPMRCMFDAKVFMDGKWLCGSHERSAKLAAAQKICPACGQRIRLKVKAEEGGRG